MIRIPKSEYIKSGYFGISSYTIYRIDTKVSFYNINNQKNKSKLSGFDENKIYSVFRRYSDFEWLHDKLQNVEKYKGCVIPSLPEKSMLKKNSEEFVEKRKLELQLYLQILSRHSEIKLDPTFRFFLTCEKSDEFEKLKNDPMQYNTESSIAVSSLKKLQIHDAFNYLYSSIKSKYFDKSEPEEMQTVLKLTEIGNHISKYQPIIDKMIKALEQRIKFTEKFVTEQEDIANMLENLEESEDPKLSKVLNNSNEYYMKNSFMYQEFIKLDTRVLSELKKEHIKLEGIKSAIADRKNNIDKYNTLVQYIKGKSDKLLQNTGDTRLADEVQNLTAEIDKVKERIHKINENLFKELDQYTINRSENLKNIMGYSCTANNEMGKKLMEFAASRQEDFPKLTIQISGPTSNETIPQEKEEESEIVNALEEHEETQEKSDKKQTKNEEVEDLSDDSKS